MSQYPRADVGPLKQNPIFNSVELCHLKATVESHNCFLPPFAMLAGLLGALTTSLCPLTPGSWDGNSSITEAAFFPPNLELWIRTAVQEVGWGSCSLVPLCNHLKKNYKLALLLSTLLRNVILTLIAGRLVMMAKVHPSCDFWERKLGKYSKQISHSHSAPEA